MYLLSYSNKTIMYFLNKMKGAQKPFFVTVLGVLSFATSVCQQCCSNEQFVIAMF